VLGQGELQVKEGYFGIAVRYADAIKTIPFVQQTTDLEYRLTADIRSLTHPDRPAIAFGEIVDPAAAAARVRRSFEALEEQLGHTYTVKPFTLADTVIAPDVKVIAFAGTPDTLTDAQRERLRAFLDRGGSLLVMASGMQLSDRGPFAFSRRVGWNALLEPYGVAIAADMVYDLASNMQVGIPAQFGQVLVPYPYWLRALSTGRSPVNADLGPVLLPWASQIDTLKAAKRGTITPLLVTSRAGGAQETTAFIDPGGQLSRDSLRSRVVAALAVAPAGGPRGRVAVIGSADFASDRYARNTPTNIVLVQNAIDWLAQDEALIAIRSKERAPPALVFTSSVTRGVAKYGNLIGVPALLIAAGILRLWRRRLSTRRTYRPVAAGVPAGATA
jgi:ABC-type uncharacterized transport system involved in gliding motility auxiliary subunit